MFVKISVCCIISTQPRLREQEVEMCRVRIAETREESELLMEEGAREDGEKSIEKLKPPPLPSHSDKYGLFISPVVFLFVYFSDYFYVLDKFWL